MKPRILGLSALLSLCLGANCVEGTASAKFEHVLNRTGYGPDAWSLERIQALGIQAYIEEQLAPASIDDSAFAARISGYPALGMSYAELRENYCTDCPNGPARRVREELSEATLLRAVYSRRQLEAVLTDFWFDHFNVNARSGDARWAIVPYVRDAIRPHVLGGFEDMLLAVAQSPAMLDYLDNRVSYKPGYVNGQGDALGFNENYARELLELHTLGVNGGFTQNDVVSVARILTGWSTDADGFRYKDWIHDKDPKLVMGSIYFPPDGGMDEGLRLIAFLASHPSTADRVARLLAERFVSEPPNEMLVQDARAAFLSTGGDLREVMRTLLHSTFLTEVNQRAKVKQPLVLLASALRALRATTAETELSRLLSELDGLGQSIYQAGPPTGFPAASSHWASEGTLLGRFNALHWVTFSPNLASDLGEAEGSSAQIVDALIERLVPGGLWPSSRAAVVAYLDSIPNQTEANRVILAASLILSSPEFLRH